MFNIFNSSKMLPVEFRGLYYEYIRNIILQSISLMGKSQGLYAQIIKGGAEHGKV